jgi:GntR family transcriptional regulator, arabinose operon transcriptional repressor
MNAIQCINKKDAVYKQLKEKIISGKYAPESRFPKEVDFAKQLGIGRVTLRSALDMLLGDGMVKRVPGKGTFVATANEIQARRYLAIMPPVDISFESPMIHIIPSIEQSAAKTSAHIQKYSVNIFKSLEVDEGVARIREGRYDGIFYMANSVNGDERDFQIIKATGLPVIMPHSNLTDHAVTGFATMRTDQKKAFHAALKLLVTKGHKQIGSIFLGGTDRKSYRDFQPAEYFELLKKLGADSSLDLVRHCTKYRYETVVESVKKLMRLPKPPTAIICTSDFVALYVYQALRKMKVKIPEQVAIMGYCNYPGGELLSPGLSTVDLFFEKIGHDAFELMLESDKWWQPGLVPPEIITPFEVIERGSTNIQHSLK